MSSVQPVTPPALDRVVRTCLAKEPDERWQIAGDLCRELKWIAEGGSQAETAAAAASRRKGPLSNLRVAWSITALALTAMLAVAIPAIVHFREAPASEMRTGIVTPPTTDPLSFAISPDGQQIVFVASGDGASRLWLRRLSAMEAQPLGNTENASFPFWSPDSRSVGYFADGKLKRVDIGGGPPRTLADATNGRGGTWGPDGTILFAPSITGALFRVSASGGEPMAATQLDQHYSHRFPQFLPGGRRFLFYVWAVPEAAGMYLGSLDSPETKRLAAADTAGSYWREGWLLFIREGALVAQRLDLDRGAIEADVVPVADQVLFNVAYFAGAFSVSASGLMAYRSGGAGQRQLIWFDRSGKRLGAMGAPDARQPYCVPVRSQGPRRSVYETIRSYGRRGTAAGIGTGQDSGGLVPRRPVPAI
jgi:hypothetical protein